MVAQALRRVAEQRPFRTILTLRPVERVVATLIRSRLVERSLRFAVRELAMREGVSVYRLRRTHADVFIRHGTGDVVTLDEVFRLRHYEPPEAIEHRLRTLGRPPVIVDLGANIGLSAAYFLLRYAGARITAVEPDEANVALLRRCLAENGWGEASTVVASAAATSDGEVPFRGGEVALSRVVPAEETTKRVRATDVMPLLCDADLVKIDIEGGEWALLGDQRLGRVAPVLVLEYHSHLCPYSDPHEAVTTLLEGAGYRVGPYFAKAEEHGMAWAVREALA